MVFSGLGCAVSIICINFEVLSNHAKIDEKMNKILYCRVSTIEQTTARQKNDLEAYTMVLEDKCPGNIPFFERPAGSQIMGMVEAEGMVPFMLCVSSIDRLGRNLRDIVNTIHYFTERKIPVHFLTQGLATIQPDGTENPITKMVIAMLGVVGEMERAQIKERQREGIAAARLRGDYTGRRSGSVEDIATFLSKPANKRLAKLICSGRSASEAAKLVGVSQNTALKVARLVLRGGKPQSASAASASNPV